MTPDELGSLISRRRKKLGFTQTDMAVLADLSVFTISHWENGEDTQQHALFLEYCELLGLELRARPLGEIPKRAQAGDCE